MIALEDAVLVLKGWEGRRLRVVFNGLGVRHLSAKCSLYAVVDTGASFVLREDVGFEFDFRGCSVEYAEPPKGSGDGDVESALAFARKDFSLLVMLLANSE
jgi:hypothetical protein